MPFLAIKIKAKPLGCNNRVYWAQKGWMGDLSVWRLLLVVAGGPPSKCQRVANNQILSKFKTTTSVTICICYTRVVIVCYSFVSACIFFKDTVFEIKFNQIVSFGGICFWMVSSLRVWKSSFKSVFTTFHLAIGSKCQALILPQAAAQMILSLIPIFARLWPKAN